MNWLCAVLRFRMVPAANAETQRVTLCGFVRDGRVTVYSVPERLSA